MCWRARLYLLDQSHVIVSALTLLRWLTRRRIQFLYIIWRRVFARHLNLYHSCAQSKQTKVDKKFPMSSHEPSPSKARRCVPLSVKRTTTNVLGVVTATVSTLPTVLSMMQERGRTISTRQSSKRRHLLTVCYLDWKISKISTMERAATTQFHLEIHLTTGNTASFTN